LSRRATRKTAPVAIALRIVGGASSSSRGLRAESYAQEYLDASARTGVGKTEITAPCQIANAFPQRSKRPNLPKSANVGRDVEQIIRESVESGRFNTCLRDEKRGLVTGAVGSRSRKPHHRCAGGDNARDGTRA